MRPGNMTTHPSRHVRRGLRRKALVVVVVVATLGGIAVQGAAPPPARAEQPPAARCQQGFLDPAAPPRAIDACAEQVPDAPVVADMVPGGFEESTVWTGLTNPTAIRFAADGRVFVAEKSGVIKVFDNLSDPTPTTFSGLSTNVQNFWDRGLLGLALDPSLTGGTGTGSYIYVLYTYDHVLGTGGGAPKWGDGCANPPGATTDGCVVSGRLSRFAVTGTSIDPTEQPLIEDWCQQYPSHSVGSLAFGPDGALYVTAGDGASFNTVDYGQLGGTTSPVVTQKNPCGDPPGDGMTPPTAEGGALRSQDLRTAPTSSGTGYPDVVLADAPLAYYRMNESSGSTLIDATGSRNGTYVGSPALAQPGAVGTGVVFDGGPGDYAQVSSWTTQPAAPASLEAWISHDGIKFAGVDTTIAGFVSAGSRALRLMAFAVDADTLELGIYTENGNAHFDWTPADQGWHHLVGTIDAAGSTGRLYLDGIQVAVSGLGYPGTGATQPFRIGTGTDLGAAGTQSWPGGIDEVAVYSQALGAAQVAAHYNARASGGASTSDPTTLDGAILRVDPATGAGMPGNPFSSSPDPNSRRIIAYGLRNPFRMTMRPGTNELWFGDVGWTTWEEVNRIPNATDSVAENFGWPCYEGSNRQGGYDGANLNICETLYAQGPSAITAPIYSYNHSSTVVSGEACPTGSSAISGLTFYPESGGSFPASYHGGLFFTDHSRECIWFMPKGTDGQPDPAARQTFATGLVGPVDLAIGPNGDLFYVDFDSGSIRRITWSGGNQSPTAAIQAVPTSGAAPLTVQFSGSGSFDPEGSALEYAWDLDGDTAFDDAIGVTASWSYSAPGNVTVRLRVTDAQQATGTATQVINVSNTAPVPTISSPTADLTWKVGDSIAFSGSASDAQDGTLPATALSWALVLQHCPSNCHAHVVQSWSGVASGSFSAPDHEYPSYLELSLTATDSFGSSATRTVRLDPQTVVLQFQTSPVGLALAVNAQSSTAPFSRTVIVGSSNSVTATSPQTVGGAGYTFASWSDGLAQSHQIIAPATTTTYTASYTTSSFAIATSADAYIRWNKTGQNFGTQSQLQVRNGQYRSYLKFVVTALTAAPSSVRLRLWVTDASPNGGSCFLVGNTWTETGITWNNAPAIPGTAISTIGAAAVGTWVECNVTSVVTGNGTYSFALSGGNNDVASYASRETANDPVLVITP